MSTFGSIFSNPIWRAKNLITYIGEVQAPTRWTFDKEGYASPTNGRPINAQEKEWMDSYNAARSRLNEARRRAIDESMRDFFPLSEGVKKAVNTNWQSALTPPRRDPLAIDLDGDGIETAGIPASGTPILFDHDADGVKTGTGWLRPDDAWLVLDRNGNGTIDSGRELFGVDTLITVEEFGLKPDGTLGLTTHTRTATSGFEALLSLDTGNGSAGSAGYRDGVFDASDAAFTSVRLWQDLNQDGVSQSNELFTLASRGVKSISLTPRKTPTWATATR